MSTSYTNLNLKTLLPKDSVRIGSRYFTGMNNDYIRNHDMIYSGIFLGEEVDGDFIPSPFFINSIADKFPSITVNDRNAWIFSLGRSITSVVKDSGEGEYVVVKSGHNEIIGLAKRHRKVFIPIWDIGHLLRREMKGTSKYITERWEELDSERGEEFRTKLVKKGTLKQEEISDWKHDEVGSDQVKKQKKYSRNFSEMGNLSNMSFDEYRSGLSKGGSKGSKNYDARPDRNGKSSKSRSKKH